MQELLNLLIMPGPLYKVNITETADNLGILIIIIQELHDHIIQDLHKETIDLMIHFQ